MVRPSPPLGKRSHFCRQGCFWPGGCDCFQRAQLRSQRATFNFYNGAEIASTCPTNRVNSNTHQALFFLRGAESVGETCLHGRDEVVCANVAAQQVVCVLSDPAQGNIAGRRTSWAIGPEGHVRQLRPLKLVDSVRVAGPQPALGDVVGCDGYTQSVWPVSVSTIAACLRASKLRTTAAMPFT